MLCAQKSVVLGRAKAPVLPRRVVSVRCNAQKPSSEEPNQAQKFALPLASMVAAALIAGAVVPDEALAANSRSGGRVGGSSGFQARKAGAPSRSVQTQAAPTVNTTTVVVAPAPVFSPFGFGMPFGGFGFGFGMPIFTPFPFFGPLLTFTFLLLVINVVFSVVKGFMASKEAKKDDSWGDL